MKTIAILILTIISFTTLSQNVSKFENRPSECCKHYEEEYGKTWTILYFASDKLDAQRLISRYQVFDIGNNFFESNESYYVELVDPSDTLEYLEKYNFNLFNDYHKGKLIFVDFLITENNEPLYDSEKNKIMFR